MLLVTGAGGFVGRELCSLLTGAGSPRVRILARNPALLSSRLPGGPWDIVQGDLLQADSLEPALAGAETVLHLAAATGKGSRRQQFAVNAAGTLALVRAAQRAGVGRFILVSSIAAGFADQRWYHYAQAKRQAEAVVEASGLDWMIVRPTMVFGPGSPVQRGLTRLAAAPVGVMFGSGQVPVQPVHVRDLALLLLAATQLRPLGRSLAEAGGPEVIPMAELLRRLRRSARGTDGPFVHLPLKPLRFLLGSIEPLLLPLLPFTAGQLGSFVNPGVASRTVEGLPRPTRSLEEILAEASHG